ncbi:MAG: hypothetical protein WBP20_00430 [Candidatus Microsaccharimonas sp.]
MILFENHVDVKTGEIFDHYFKKDVEHIRESISKEKPYTELSNEMPKPLNLVLGLALRYKFPVNMVDFLGAFVVSGIIDPSLISSQIKIIDDRNEILTADKESSHETWKQYKDVAARLPAPFNAELKIVIGDEVSREQLRDYITDHWDAIEVGIRAKPKAYERTIIRPHLNARRDYRLIALLESGLTYDEVALQIQKEYPGYVPTYMAIQKIKSKIKGLRDTNFDV